MFRSYKCLFICKGSVFGVFFFFSSRRRHTRFDCDWSSDVCSSDASVLDQFQATLGQVVHLHEPLVGQVRLDHLAGTVAARHLQLVRLGLRSEEHTSELQSQSNLVCRLLLEKKKKRKEYSILYTP